MKTPKQNAENTGFLLDIEKRFCYNFKAVRRDVAQFGSAPDLGSGGRRFKSCRPDQKQHRNMIKGCRQVARQRSLDPLFRWFESSHPCQQEHCLTAVLSNYKETRCDYAASGFFISQSVFTDQNLWVIWCAKCNDTSLCFYTANAIPGVK